MPLSPGEKEERAFQLGRIFKPATPINRVDLFAGRQSQTQDVLDAINQNGQHVVLYGERGVGKTSLANVLFPKLRCPGHEVMTPQINCTSQDTFSAIWKRVFEEIQFKEDTTEHLDIPEAVVNLLADYTQQYADELSPDIIRRVLLELGSRVLLVVIIDEFDTVESDEVRQTMADTLKFLSDRNVPATVVLIGVADDVEGLIADHQSTERCIVQVPMPRMSRREIEDVVTTCLTIAKMGIDTLALRDISRISKGLPHYAHLLGLHAGRAAVEQGSITVTQDHVSRGIRTAIGKAQASIQQHYRRAISSARKDAQYREVLLACAMARTDEFGYFSPVNVREPLSRIRKEECKIEAFARHLHAFSGTDRGPVLRKEEYGKRARFRFANPLIQPYVLLKGVADGLISEEDLKEAT